MKSAEVLDRMAERLRTEGWVKMIAWSYKFIRTPEAPQGVIVPGEACLQGTCEIVSGTNMNVWAEPEVGRVLSDAITALFPDRLHGDLLTPWGRVVWFNDHRDTSFEDVMLVVKHARESAG